MIRPPVVRRLRVATLAPAATAAPTFKPARAEPLEGRRYLTRGELDPAFGGGDGWMNFDHGGNQRGEAVVVQPDGKFIVGQTAGADAEFQLTRFLPNGTPDNTFSGDGTVTLPIAGVEELTDLALQPDGKILLVGHTTSTALAGQTKTFVVRLGGNGVADTTFNGGFVFVDFPGSDRGAAVAVDTVGRVLVAGTAFVGAGDDFAVARLLSNGGFDNTFDTDGKAVFGLAGLDVCTDMAVTADDRAVLGGYSNMGLTDAHNNFAVLRVTAAGARDGTFGTGLGMNFIDFGYDDRAHALVLDAAGRVVLGGADDGTAPDFALARLTLDGLLDTSFNDLPAPTNYNGDGRLSFTFGPGTFGGVERIFDLVALPNGGVAAVGVTDANRDGSIGTGTNFGVAAVRGDGTLDPNFDDDGRRVLNYGALDVGRGIALAGDRSLILIGSTGTSGTEEDVQVIRLRGGLDVGFNNGGAARLSFGHEDVAEAVAIDALGRAVVAGSWDGGLADFVIARYLANGQLDPSFDSPADSVSPGRVNLTFGLGTFGGDEYAQDLVIQPDGKIVVVGSTDAASGGAEPDVAVVRLNANGTIDTTFGGGDGRVVLPRPLIQSAFSVALRPNGNILLGIGEEHASGQYGIRVHELQPSGTDVAGASILLWASGGSLFYGDLALAPDGRVVIGGTVETSSGRLPYIQRLTEGLAVDPSFGGPRTIFTPFPGVSYSVGAIAVAADGKVIVAGTSSFALSSDLSVVRLNVDGTTDASFGGAGGASVSFGGSEVSADVLIQPDGKVIVVGDASQALFSGRSDFVAARFTTNGLIDPTFGPGFDVAGDGLFRYDFGGGLNDHANAAALAPDGSVVIVGATPGASGLDFDFGIVRLLPAVTEAASARYLFDGSPVTAQPVFRMQLPRYVSFPSVDVGDVALRNLTTGTDIPFTQLAILYVPAERAIEIRYLGTGNVLPDGNYRLRLHPGSIEDTAGNVLPTADYFDFVLSGDANRDRRVDFSDLLILAQNYGLSGRRFSQGDFNYSAGGQVNFDDLLLLAQRYGTGLLAAAPATTMSTATRAKRSRAAEVL